MARQVSIQLIDDLDSSPAIETLHFGLDGTQYDIDLNAFHAREFRDSFGPWTSHARKGKRAKVAKTATAKHGTDFDPSAVRAWARSNGITVSSRGHIPNDIVARFHEAGY